MAIKILLADDHHVVRQGLRALLEAQSDMEVVGEIDDGLGVVELVRKLQPGVVILDLLMPGLNGREVTRRLRDSTSRVKVVILTMYTNESYVIEAFKYGANGYVLKQSDSSELVRAVREVAAGRTYLSPPFSQGTIEAYFQKAQAIVQDPYDTLTGREREVLQLAAEGYTNAQIAERLVVSTRTVEGYRANMMSKLQLKTKLDLFRYAMWRGILPVDSGLKWQNPET